MSQYFFDSSVIIEFAKNNHLAVSIVEKLNKKEGSFMKNCW